MVRAVARGLRRTSRSADGDVRRFMNENLHRVRRVPRTLPPLLTAGRVHDLQQVFDRAERALLRRRACACPSPGAAGSGRARRGGLTFGSYDPVLALIRIHPVLDRRDVPLYFLESVVYHEMLHHHLGGVPDRAGPHRLPLARLPRGGGALSPGTGRPWPGRRRTFPTCCGPATSWTASARRRPRRAPQRLKPAAPPPPAPPVPPAPPPAAPRRPAPACCCPPPSPWPRPGCCATRWTTSPLGVTRDKLCLYAGLMVGVVLVEGVFRYHMRMILIGISREIEYELRNDLFAHLTRLPARYYQPHRIGDLMSRATNDLSAVRMVLGPGIMYTANTARHLRGHHRPHGHHQPAGCSGCRWCRCSSSPSSCATSAAASTTASRRCRRSSPT